MRVGSGHLELIGPTWFLRLRRSTVDRSTGEVTKRQERITIGPKKDLRSETAARKAADRWLASQQAETLEVGVQASMLEYLAHYLAIHVALMRPSSQRGYKSVFRTHLVPEFEGELLESVDVRRIQAFVSRIAPHMARATVRSILSKLLQVMAQARRDGFSVHRIDRQAVKLPKASAIGRAKRNIGNAELQILIDGSARPWNVLWAVMGYAGLRCAEALGLTWADVNIDARVISISQQAVRGQLLLPKTATSQADIPILDELLPILEAYRGEWVNNPQGLLFISRAGTPLIADNVRTRQLQPTLKRLGLNHGGLHAFRHGLPARLDALGVSPGVIQKCMRHASLEQTEAYLHVGTDDVHAALDAARVRSKGSATIHSA